MDNPQQADVAYAAGFWEGEGSVGAYVGGGLCRNSLVFVVSVWQSSLPVLEWFKEHFGGGVYRRQNAGYGKNSNKSAAEWRATGWAAYNFLQLVRPYLKVRDVDADEMIEIWESRLDKEAPEGYLKYLCDERKKRRAAATTKRRDTDDVGDAIV